GRLFRGDFSMDPGTSPSKQWMPITHKNALATAPHGDSRVITFANGVMLEGDDGGIYRLNNPDQSTRVWGSAQGNLANTEFNSIAYDSAKNVLIGGAQDVGVSVQSLTGTPAYPLWTDLSQADGGNVRVDNSNPAAPVYYYSSQNLSGFRRE